MIFRGGPLLAAAKSLQSCPTVQPPRRQPTRLPHPWDSPGKKRMKEGNACHFLLQCTKVKSQSEVAQSCPTLSNPMDGPGKSTGVGCHFLLQCIKVKSESEVAQSCPTLSNPMDCSLPGSSIFSRQEYWSGVPLPQLLSPSSATREASVCVYTHSYLCVFIHMYGEGNGTPLQYSCLENPMDGGAWWAAVHGVAEGRTRLSDFTFTFHFHALEKEMATHSSVLAWRIPGTGEPGGLPSLGSRRVGHD